MPLKFSTNLSTMFGEYDLCDRFEKARDYGFASFEIQNPYEVSKELFTLKKGSMSCDLVNIYCGSYKWGCAATPVAEGDFFSNLAKTTDYFYCLNFKKLHILSGEKSTNFTKEDQFERLVSNLTSLVATEYFENLNIIGVIEPICGEVNENYFLNSFDTAVDVIKSVGSDQLKLLLDIYHLHKITGDVKKYLDVYYPYAGHIQVSQDPGRKEPFGSGGNIDYNFVFEYLEKKGHKDYIGLEYTPSGTTEDSLEWMSNYTV